MSSRQECSAFAAPGLCLAAFPPCGAAGRARRICRDECELLRDARCKREHAIALAHPIISQVVLPVCERLPPVGSPEAAGCLRLGVPAVAPPRPADTCFHGDGAEYRGLEARAASGRRCRAWSRHGRYAELARQQPAVLGGHAFCRTWGGQQPQPWCFTAADGGDVQREPCAVPRCRRPLLWYIWYIALPWLVPDDATVSHSAGYLTDSATPASNEMLSLLVLINSGAFYVSSGVMGPSRWCW